jgi:taurine transport system substrate-binding protein
MNKFFVKALVCVGAMALVSTFSTAQAEQAITIGTFGDPTPMQWAAHEHKFSAATGWDIKWRKFGSGSDVISAMASGDLKISELGSTPLAIAASQGVNLEVFMVDYVIGKAESLIARDGTGIKTLADLKGKRIAVPFGSTSDFALRGALKHAGIKLSQVTLLNMSPDQIVAAWKQGYIDAAYIWSPAQTEILQTGHRLVGSDQVAAWGYPTFNAWVVNKKFAETHKKQLIAFIKELNKVNMGYMNDPASWTVENPVVKAVAAQVGDTPSQVIVSIKGYKFLTSQEQLGKPWLGGGIATAMKSTAELLKQEGMISTVGTDYSKFVNPEYARAAAK